MRKVLIVAVMAIVSGQAALAAAPQVAGKLLKVVGSVTVNGAKASGGALAVGDLIGTGKDSSAIVSYQDGCKISIAPNSSVKIGLPSPCALKAGGVAGAAGVAVLGTGAGVSTAAVVGGFAILGAAGGIAALAANNSSSP